jgi:hypothetical protein
MLALTWTSHHRHVGDIGLKHVLATVVDNRKEAPMIATVELEDDERFAPPVTWSYPRREGDWIDGYDGLFRAAHSLSRGASFLARHWNEVEAETLVGLLRSIEATAYDVERMLGRERGEPLLLDESLAARVGSL